MAIQALKDAPTIDVNEVIAQFKWERDTAIEQLHEIGKGLGSRMDDVATVVRCKDCKHWVNGFCITEMKFNLAETDFCSWGERKDNETD